MEQQLFNFVQQDVQIGLVIIFVCCVFVVLATLFDFWTAWEAVKARKAKLSSHPLRRTGQKIIDYIRLILYVLMADVIGFLCFGFYDIPFFVVFTTLGILACEGVSMKENYKLKNSNAVEAIDMTTEIIKCLSKEEAERIIQKMSNLHNINTKKFR